MAHTHSSHKRRPITRSASLLGSIKQLVTAPFHWLATPDDHINDNNKRPRSPSPRHDLNDPPLHQSPPRSKKLRLDTPPSVPPHTLSPIPRQSSLSRTMSIDPPPRVLARGHSLNPITNATTTSRDLSMPPSIPLSARPSFRMRTMTPQPSPALRDRSEPPPLTSLLSNPVFVHGPPPHQTQHLSRQDSATTLGSLVESVRRTQSPVRRHSSLLFGSTSTHDLKTTSSQLTPAQKALHELEVYKTPLLPTRIRSTNSASSSVTASAGIPDMFKSRRAKNLVLMHDDRRADSLTSSLTKSPANNTKPYAGEGGMKKLLARRKLEEEEHKQADTPDNHDDDAMDDGQNPVEIAITAPSSIPADPPPKPDWFATSTPASSTTSGSSLRVGRTKSSRNHIARPQKNRFSAVYEDDGELDVDDAMGGDEATRKKELEELENAASKAPAFNIPVDFTFAPKEPIQHDLTIAKEPPITSLPFSFAKPAVTPVTVPAPATESTAQHAISATQLPGSPPKIEPPLTANKGGIPNFFAGSALLAKTTTNNLFPDSSMIPKISITAEGSKPPPPVHSVPSESVRDAGNSLWDGNKEDTGKNQISETSAFLPDQSMTNHNVSGPSKPVDSPFSLGRPAESAFSFAQPSESSNKPAESNFSFPKPTELSNNRSAPAFSFGKPAETAFAFGKPAEATDKPSGSAFSFSPAPGNDTNEGSSSKDKPTPGFTFCGSSESVQLKSTIIGDSESAKAPQTALFGGTDSKSVFGNNSGQKSSTLFGSDNSSAPTQAQNTTGLFGSDSSKLPSLSPVPFSFGQPATTEAPKQIFSTGKPVNSTVEAPKPLLGGGGFSFGADKEKPTHSLGSSSTPAPAENKTPIFSFGSSPAPLTNSAAPAGPLAFSFSGGGSSATDVSSKPFSFGTPTTVVPDDRPVTPPKNVDQDRMEESPTRELQPIKPPPLAFSFSAPTPTTGLGVSSPSQTTSPFLFGGSSPQPSNPFASKDVKPPEIKSFSGFGATNINTASTTGGFTFGANKTEPQPPSTASSFSFSTTPTTTAPAFSFGTPSSSNNTSGFGNTLSAPSSPSTFNQSSPFSFGAQSSAAQLQATSNPFAFGSQPASPASVDTTLPGPGTNAFGQTPSSPFSAPTQLAPSTSSGGTLFTIGAPPIQSPASGGARQIRKMPTRRGGKR